MKILISFIICFGSSLIPNRTEVQSKKISYYFCVSHTISTNSKSQKQNVLYTGIDTIASDEEMISLKTKEWAKYVVDNCRNENGCTSDLNYYQTEEQAETECSKMIMKLSDTAKYIAAKVVLK
jgi:hypothetical protein